MDDFIEKRLSLVSFNPFFEKKNNELQPNPLRLAHQSPDKQLSEDSETSFSGNFKCPPETEEQKAQLIDNLLSHLKIRRITPVGREALDEVLNYGIDFSDPDWQRDIQSYYDVAKDLEESIGMLRDFGGSYFKNGIVPPSVYSTALVIEFGEENRNLPYAEKKTFRAVNQLFSRFGKDMENEKPQAQILFLNCVKNRIDYDQSTYFLEDNEETHQDLLEKYLNFYIPISKNLVQNTPFEHKIQEHLFELEALLSLKDEPKAKVFNFIKLKTIAEQQDRQYEPVLPDGQKNKVARTIIVPDEDHRHILFE